MKIIPVLISFIMSLFSLTSFAGHPYSADEPICSDLTIFNNSPCDQKIYIELIGGETLSVELIGEIPAGEQLRIGTTSEIAFIYAVSPSGEVTAGYLKSDCIDIELKLTSCSSQEVQLERPCLFEGIEYSLNNGENLPIEEELISLSCGQSIDIMLLDQAGKWVIEYPDNTLKLLPSGTRFNLADFAKITDSGLYVAHWFATNGCRSSSIFTLQTLNCCEREMANIPDSNICEGESIKITPEFSEIPQCIDLRSDYGASVYSYSGRVENVENILGEPDNSGTILWKAGTGNATYITVDLGSILPSGTEICIFARIAHCQRVDSNDSQFSIYTSASVFGFKRFTTKSMPLDTKYEEICITVNEEARYIRIQDEGLCAFRLDAIKISSQRSNNSISYLWSDGSTDESLDIVSSGTYSVQITDCNDCISYQEFDILVDACEVDLDCIKNARLPSANGETFTMCAEKGGMNGSISINDLDSDGHELQWLVTKTPDHGTFEINDAGTFSYVPNDDFVGSDRIFYNVCKKDFTPCDQADLNKRCASAIALINVNKAAISLGEDRILCEGQSLVLDSNTSATAKWSTGQTNPIITIDKGGTYAVSITDVNGCQASDQIEVREYAYPIPTLSVSNMLDCDNPSAIISASGGVDYIWGSGQIGRDIAVTEAGVYSVTVTGEGGCSAASQITVTENINLVTARISGNELICNAIDRVELTASGADRYVWSTGDTDATIEVRGPGTYSVRAIDASTGCSDTESFTIRSLDIYADAGPDQNACPGEVLVLGGSSIGPEGANYQWSNGSSGNLIASDGKITVSPTRTTTYELTTTLNGCTSVDQVTVYLDDFQISTNGAVEICPGEEVVLSAQGADFYLWETGVQDESITVRPSESRTYTVTGFNSFGCSKEAQVNVTVYDPVQAQVTADQETCAGETVALSASGGSVYAWSNGSIGPNISVVAQQSEAYRVTITNSQGCETVEDININVVELPDANLGADKLICVGAAVELRAAESSSYLWSTGETSRIITVSPESNTEYSITVTNNVCATSSNINVNVAQCFGQVTGSVRNTNGDPLPGVNLRIFNEENVRVQTASTDPRGFYRFVQMESGSYTIRQENLEGYTDFSDRDDTPEDGIDNDGINNEIPVILLPGETDADNNFVDQENVSSITGTSSVDTDGDDLPDEPLRNVAIMLYDSEENLLDISVTDPFGRYSFEGLSSGSYLIKQDNLSGYSLVSDKDRTITTIDPDGGDDLVDNSIKVELSVSEIDDGNDFVVRPLNGIISGYVGLDIDEDGLSDQALVDTRVELLNRFGTRQQISFSDDDGYYEFVDIAPGEYRVKAIDNPKYRDVSDRDESTGPADNDGGSYVVDDLITVILLPGEHDEDNNFVDYIPQVGIIGGYVLEDQNDDQIGDRGINDVVITLYDLSNREIAVTATNPAGRFIFRDVIPGDYYLRETDPVDANGLEYIDVSDLDVGDPDDGNDIDEANDIIYVSIEVDEFDDDNIFVDRKPSSSFIEDCEVLQFDDFSNGFGDFWIDGGDNVEISQRYSRSSPVSVDISNDEGSQSSIYSQTLDLNTVNSITITFHYITRGVDDGEFFVFEVSLDGGATYTGFESWFIDADFVNEEWNSAIVSIPSDLLSARSSFRIRSNFSSRADHVYIDDILVELCFNVEDDDSSATAFVDSPADETTFAGGQALGNKAPILKGMVDHGKIHEYSIKPSLYPNPAVDLLYIDYKDLEAPVNSVVEIFNLNGQRLINENISGRNPMKLDISRLKPKQLYILTIKSIDQSSSYHFFKM